MPVSPHHEQICRYGLRLFQDHGRARSIHDPDLWYIVLPGRITHKFLLAESNQTLMDLIAQFRDSFVAQRLLAPHALGRN